MRLSDSGQRCDCTDHDMSRDRIISRLRGELHILKEQMKKAEPTKPLKPPLPTIYVITPTYARYTTAYFIMAFIIRFVIS